MILEILNRKKENLLQEIERKLSSEYSENDITVDMDIIDYNNDDDTVEVKLSISIDADKTEKF